MTPSLLKQMATGVQGQICPDSSPLTVTVGNFKHMSFKLKLNKGSELKFAIDSMKWTNIYKIF